MSDVSPDDAQGHFDRIGDTGVGYTERGRGYIIECAWCGMLFAAKRKGQAIELYRQHEADLRDRVFPPPPIAPDDRSPVELLNDFPD